MVQQRTAREYYLDLNGTQYTVKDGDTFADLAAQVENEYSDTILLARLDNEIFELRDVIARSGKLKFLTAADPFGRRAYSRSLTFLMECASRRIKRGLHVRVEYAIGNGYFCEFYFRDKQERTTPELLSLLKEAMLQIVAEDHPIEKITAPLDLVTQAVHYVGIKDKELMLRYHRDGDIIFYQMDGMYDYYYGQMVPSSGCLKYFELQAYKDGFILMYPTIRPNAIEPFKTMDKLYETFEESKDWGKLIGIDTVGTLNKAISEGTIREIIHVQEALMEKKIGDIADEIARDPKIKVVLIAGPSSSGKTTFSHRLSTQMITHGLHPHPISMDDFYVNRVDTPLDENGNYDFESIYALDIPLLNHFIQALIDGLPVEIPRYNFKTGKREYRGEILTFGERDVLVMEGIHGLNEELTRQISRESKFKIYISALTQLKIDYHNYLSTTDCRMIRRMVRDARTRNTTAKETIRRWPSVREGEERNIFPFQEEADVMFSSALIYEMAVLKVIAEPLLFQVERSDPEYPEARRMLRFLEYFLPLPGDCVGRMSILREFIGGGCFDV